MGEEPGHLPPGYAYASSFNREIELNFTKICKSRFSTESAILSLLCIWYLDFWFAIGMGVLLLIILYICFAKWLGWRQKQRRDADEEAQRATDLVEVRYVNVSLFVAPVTMKQYIT